MPSKKEIREAFRKSMEQIDATAQRRGIRGRRSPYGKKGGTSVNAGKKAVTYEATLPDGRVVRKRSYTVDQPEAYLGYFFADGYKKLLYSGIFAAPVEDIGQKFVKAVRID